MKSSLNVRYNVYVPKEEQNSATQLKYVTQTIYPLDSKFKRQRSASSVEHMCLLADESRSRKH